MAGSFARTEKSEQRAKLIGREAGVAGNGTHRHRIDRGVTGNDETNLTVAHYDVSALANNALAHFLKHPDRVVLADSRDARHGLHQHFGLFDPFEASLLRFNFEPEANRILDICQSLGPRGSL